MGFQDSLWLTLFWLLGHCWNGHPRWFLTNFFMVIFWFYGLLLEWASKAALWPVGELKGGHDDEDFLGNHCDESSMIAKYGSS